MWAFKAQSVKRENVMVTIWTAKDNLYFKLCQDHRSQQKGRLTGFNILKFPPEKVWFIVTFYCLHQILLQNLITFWWPLRSLSVPSQSVQTPGLWAVLQRGINEYFIIMRAETCTEGESLLDSIWLWHYAGLTNNMEMKVLKGSSGNIFVVYEMVYRLYELVYGFVRVSHIWE